MTSINDTFILLSLINRLIKECVNNQNVAVGLIQLFEDIKFRTEIGQMMDLNTVDQEDHSLNFQYVLHFLITILILW